MCAEAAAGWTSTVVPVLRARCPSVTKDAAARPKRVQRLSKKRLVVLAVPLLFGVWLGYLTSEGILRGGLDAAFALAGLALAGVILVIHAFVALLHWRWPDRAGRPAARAIALSAALLIVGLGSGWLAAIGVHAFRTGVPAPVDPGRSPDPSPTVPSAAWTGTGDLVVARNEHEAVLLLDGRVLVIGGIGDDSRTLRSAELYEPASGTWTAAGNMRAPRWDHTATTLLDGTVLVAGGEVSVTGTVEVGSAELYDPASGTWTDVANMTQARWGHTATLLPDGTVLVAGNSTSELYDPLTKSWTATGAMVARREGHTATLLRDGTVLVAGGCCGTTDPNGSSELASAELFDPRTGAWTATGAASGVRTEHTATLLPNGKVLIAGGYIGGGDVVTALASAELYDPDLKAWTPAGDMTDERWPATATLLPDGIVLVTSSLGRISSAELYSSGTWIAIVPMIQDRSAHTATLLLDGSVLVAGGTDNPTGTVLASTELFDPTVAPQPR